MTKIKSRRFKNFQKYNMNIWDHTYGKILKVDLIPEEKSELDPLFSTNLSSYGDTLFTKQLLKNFYGDLSEKYLVSIIQKAKKKKGILSENVLILLERRLDTVVYRLNFARSIHEAKQLVSHGHVFVNGKKVTFPKYTVQNGDIVNLSLKGTLISYQRVWQYLLSLSNARKLNLQSNDISFLLNPCLKPISSHLEVQYGEPWKGSLFMGIFITTPTENDILKSFPFRLNIDLLLQFYRN